MIKHRMGSLQEHPSEKLELDVSHIQYLSNKSCEESRNNVLSEKSVLSSEHVQHVERPGDRLHLNRDAFAASKREHCMTFVEGLKLYPKAVCWSILISAAIVMEGFDTALINAFFAFGEFRKAYGVSTGDGNYEITAQWQTALNNGAVASSIVGLFANGVLTEIFGYKRTMLGALLMLAACIFIPFFSVNIQMLLAGQILCGFSWGVFSTLTTTYAAEVMPLNLRGYLTANVNLCWLIGQITAIGILRGLIDLRSSWSYRIPFGLQWVWIFGLLIVSCTAPESPWWLIRQKRLDDAKKVILRLTRRGYDLDVDSIVSIMDHTNTTERGMNGHRARDLSFAQCFRGVNLRRTEIACMTFMIQNLCGLPVISFAAYFYSRLGFEQHKIFDLTMILQGIAVLGSLCSIFLMRWFGRRQLYLGGLFLIMLTLTAAGVVSSFPETQKNSWATAALIMVFIFVFDCTLGPVTYCIVAEVPSTRLRVKTVVLARVSYNLSALVTNIIQTRMLNPLDWNLRGKSCFFWAGSCIFCLLYCYYRLPETKGLTYLELNILFDKRAKAKQFSTLQKKLASCGYFSFDDHENRRPQWTETGSRIAPQSPQEVSIQHETKLEKV